MDSPNELYFAKSFLEKPVLQGILLMPIIIVMTYFLCRRVADLISQHIQPNALVQELIKIDPLPEQDYESIPEKTYRPFKPTFQMTMGLGKVSRNEWIDIDCNYRTQIADRTHILQSHSDEVLGITPDAKHLVSELYSEIILHHLPQRFPSIFSLSADCSTFSNGVTGQSFRAQRDFENSNDVNASLRILAVSVVEDFFILRQDEPTGKHHLCAFVACYPNGFQTQKLIGKSVSDIHTPVPLYKEKLEMSVDRFFRTLKAGDFMRRFNWSLTTCGHKLFTPRGLNSYQSRTDSDDENNEFDIQDVYLRVERQIMTRLSRSRAVIFTVKTFMTPLSKIRDEGTGQQLLAAVKVWPEKVAFYKRRPYWFKKVCEYLEESRNENEQS